MRWLLGRRLERLIETDFGVRRVEPSFETFLADQCERFDLGQ